MKDAELGAKWSLSAGSISQAVVPATGLPSASVQSKAAPPQAWTSIPRCRLYQACSDGASLALKKMPPMPVARLMVPPMHGGGEGVVSRHALPAHRPGVVRQEGGENDGEHGETERIGVAHHLHPAKEEQAAEIGDDRPDQRGEQEREREA